MRKQEQREQKGTRITQRVRQGHMVGLLRLTRRVCVLTFEFDQPLAIGVENVHAFSYQYGRKGSPTFGEPG